MPIYEYFCPSCRKQVSIFFRSMQRAAQEEARCPVCGSDSLQRLVSRVNTARSEERRLEEMASSGLMQGLEQENPQALAAFMRQMQDELGEPMDDEMNEAIEQWETGAPLGAASRASQAAGNATESDVDAAPPLVDAAAADTPSVSTEA
jgi:putative FmdB family regulatory protein